MQLRYATMPDINDHRNLIQQGEGSILTALLYIFGSFVSMALAIWGALKFQVSKKAQPMPLTQVTNEINEVKKKLESALMSFVAIQGELTAVKEKVASSLELQSRIYDMDGMLSEVRGHTKAALDAIGAFDRKVNRIEDKVDANATHIAEIKGQLRGRRRRFEEEDTDH